MPCCQGTNPQPTASAICGFFFNIDPSNTFGVNSAICGESNMILDVVKTVKSYSKFMGYMYEQ